MKKHDFGTLPVKDLVSISQLSVGDIATIFSAAGELKRNRYKHDALLRGRRSEEHTSEL